MGTQGRVHGYRVGTCRYPPCTYPVHHVPSCRLPSRNLQLRNSNSASKVLFRTFDLGRPPHLTSDSSFTLTCALARRARYCADIPDHTGCWTQRGPQAPLLDGIARLCLAPRRSHVPGTCSLRSFTRITRLEQAQESRRSRYPREKQEIPISQGKAGIPRNIGLRGIRNPRNIGLRGIKNPGNPWISQESMRKYHLGMSGIMRNHHFRVLSGISGESGESFGRF